MTCILTTVSGNPNGIASISPGLALQRLPWVNVQRNDINPERVASFVTADTTPSGLFAFADFSQGSSQAHNPGLNDGIPLGFISPFCRSEINECECRAPLRPVTSNARET
jgi:hypothetical protein